MILKNNKIITANPALGVLPIVGFMILGNYIPYSTALIIGIWTYIFFLLAGIFVIKYSPPLMLIVVGITFLIYLVFSTFSPLKHVNNLYFPLIFEIIFVLCLWLINFFKLPIRASVTKKNQSTVTVLKVTRLNEFFLVCKLYQNILSWHLLFVLVYQLLPIEYHSPDIEKFIFQKLSLILIALVIIYESIRLVMLQKEINLEDWLPVVNEAGNVIGKVAFSVSQSSKKLFLHPVIRIALVYRGLLYLMERPEFFIMDPQKTDYPFEKYVRYSHNLDDAVHNILLARAGVKDYPVRFIFRYLFKNDKTNRLIYLYTLQIHDEETMDKFKFASGKLWTKKQIEENIGTGVFSEFFEKEYEILSNTILLVDNTINPSPPVAPEISNAKLDQHQNS